MSDCGKRTFWLSFANEERSGGVVIVDLIQDECHGDFRGSAVVSAIMKTIALGINPGPDYEVRGQEIPQGDIPEHYKHRLLNSTEANLAQGKSEVSGLRVRPPHPH